jgi:hypothetical protein
MNETPQEPSTDVPVPHSDIGWLQSMIAGYRQRNVSRAQVSGRVEVVAPLLPPRPEVLLQAAIILTGDRTQEGILVQGVAVAWEEIIRQLAQGP